MTPFADAPHGTPYWLRPRDLMHEREHMKLILAMERLVKLIRERAKP